MWFLLYVFLFTGEFLNLRDVPATFMLHWVPLYSHTIAFLKKIHVNFQKPRTKDAYVRILGKTQNVVQDNDEKKQQENPVTS